MDVHFGNLVRAVMDHNDLSVLEMARLLKKSSQAVYDDLKKEDLNTKVLRKLSEATNIPMQNFFSDDSEFFLEKSPVTIGNNNKVTGGDKYQFKETKALKEQVKSLKKELELCYKIIKLYEDKYGKIT